VSGSGPDSRPAATPVRNLTLLRRKPGISVEEFQHHWLEVHGPLVSALPGVRRYAQNHVTASATRAGYPTVELGIDGIVEFVFESAESMREAFDSEAGRRAMADAPNFIEAMRVYTVEEHVIVPRPAPPA
jgi:uncharacterized protein (TIGR02118 family)